MKLYVYLYNNNINYFKKSLKSKLSSILLKLEKYTHLTAQGSKEPS